MATHEAPMVQNINAHKDLVGKTPEIKDQFDSAGVTVRRILKWILNKEG